MLDLTENGLISIGLLLLGAGLWALCPLLEAIAGDRGATSALVGGVVALVVSSITGLPGEVANLPFVAFLPLLVLSWGVCVYCVFRLTPDAQQPAHEIEKVHCIPKLVNGTPHDYTFKKWKLRTKLLVHCYVVPSDCELEVSAWASGRAFYGFFFQRASLELKPSVEVTCSTMPEANSPSRAYGQVRDQSEYNESPLLVRVDHTISSSSDEITVRTVITAAVAASGGSLGIGLGTVFGTPSGGSVGLTGAALGTRAEMGTFTWRCSPLS